MNAAKAFESFLLFEGEEKLIIERDTKLSNSIVFTVNKEDHTMGNLLRQQILNDDKVIFAGYKHPHPLDNYILLRLQTENGYSPQEALSTAISSLNTKLGEFEGKFKSLVQEKKDF